MVADVEILEKTVWFPAHIEPDGDLTVQYFDGSTVKVEKGMSQLKSVEIGAVGPGAEIEGKMKGKITSYDYKALYKIYNLKDDQSVDVWIFNYKNDKTRSELKKVNESSDKLETDVDLKFKVKGNDKGISKVWIGFAVLRVTTDTTTKDYSVTNKNSAGATDEKGNKYDDIKFEEVK
jgi:hypothetical protein